MLLDSIQGLRDLCERFVRFLESSSQEVSFPAITVGDPAPYEELLGGLRVKKAESNNCLSFSNDGWLLLSATHKDLSDFSKALLVKKDGDHNHWYSRPVSLIIEADEWRASSES